MINSKLKKFFSISILTLIVLMSFSVKAYALSDSVVIQSQTGTKATSITLTGKYTFSMAAVAHTHFRYGTDQAVDAADTKICTAIAPSAVDQGTFPCAFFGLQPETKYYAKAIADYQNSLGVLVNLESLQSYSFTTNPNIAMKPITGLTDTSVTFTGTYTLDDKVGMSIPKTYFRYGTDPALTLTTVKTPDFTEPTVADSGDFSSPPVSPLIPGTTYYVKAGVSYINILGATVSYESKQPTKFTTLCTLPQVLDPQSNTCTTPTTPSPAPTPQAPCTPVLTTSGLAVCTECCGFNELILQIQKIIAFLLFEMAIPLAAIVFTWAGCKFMTSGENAGERTKAKGMFLNVLIGLAIAMAAWLIINTILTTLLVNPTNTQYNLLKNPN